MFFFLIWRPFSEGEASVLYMTFVFPPGHLKCRLFVFKYTRISRSLISDFVTVNLERRREKKKREEGRGAGPHERLITCNVTNPFALLL